MRPTDYQKTHEIGAYNSLDDIGLVFFTYNGIVTESLNLRLSVDDINRVNHISRLYYYLCGFCNLQNIRFVVHYPNHRLPDYWHDMTGLEQGVKGLVQGMQEWMIHNKFNTGALVWNIDTILRSLYNLCAIIHIAPITCLDIGLLSIQKQIIRIPKELFLYPLIMKPGVNGRNIDRNNQYLNWVIESQYSKKNLRGRQIKERKSNLDKRWLKCFKHMFKDIDDLR